MVDTVSHTYKYLHAIHRIRSSASEISLCWEKFSKFTEKNAERNAFKKN